MKRFLIAFVLALSIPFSVFAADFEQSEYDKTLSKYDFSFFEKSLDESTYNILKELNIEDFNFESINSLSLDSIIKIISKMIKGELNTPLKTSCLVMILVIISCFIRIFEKQNEELDGVIGVVSSLIIASLILTRVSVTVASSVTALKIASNFIYGFIPVFCAITIASGNTLVGFSTNTMLIILSQGLSFLASNLFMPVINCFFALGICSSLRFDLHLSKMIATLKKIITTCISFVFGVFISVLSIKTAVAGRADMLGLRSIRFAINAVIPVIGSSISEGLLSIQGYSSLIKSSVGLVGIISLVFVFLQPIIEVMMWRLLLSICSLLADVFGENTVSTMLLALREAMLLINIVLIMSLVTTIISIGIIIASRGGT